MCVCIYVYNCTQYVYSIYVFTCVYIHVCRNCTLFSMYTLHIYRYCASRHWHCGTHFHYYQHECVERHVDRRLVGTDLLVGAAIPSLSLSLSQAYNIRSHQPWWSCPWSFPPCIARRSTMSNGAF